jgi:hypothetical protein
MPSVRERTYCMRGLIRGLSFVAAGQRISRKLKVLEPAYIAAPRGCTLPHTGAKNGLDWVNALSAIGTVQWR